MTILNPTTETIDLDEAYCPNCGPVHCLDNGGVTSRSGPVRCAACSWEGTNGDLLDLLAELDDDEDLGDTPRGR